MALTEVPIELSSTPGIVDNSNATAITIDSSENVGIGTTSPTEQLHVANGNDAVILVESTGSDATDDANIQLKTTNGTFTIQNDRSIGTSGALTFAGNTSNNIVIDHNSGQVGIGTASPVSIAGYTITTLDNSGSGSALYLQQAGATKGRVITTANELTVDTTTSIPLVFGTNSTERMRIDSSGNLLVGRTSRLTSQVESISSDTVVSAHGTLTSHQTNAAIMQFTSNKMILRSYGATAGTGQMVFNTGGGGGSADFEAMRINSSGDLLIGRTTTPPTAGAKLAVLGTGDTAIQVTKSGVIAGRMSAVTTGIAFGVDGSDGATERMRLDSGGNLLVGKSALGSNNVGAELRPEGYIFGTGDGINPLRLNRQTSDGMIADFQKDGTSVGSIGTLSGYITIGRDDTAIVFQSAEDNIQPFNQTTNSGRDAAIDLGKDTVRFKDLYLSNESRVAGSARGRLENFYRSGNGRTFTITGGSNGALAELEFTASNHVGYVRKYYHCYNVSGNWTVTERESSTSGTAQTVTISNNGTGTVTVNVTSSTGSYSGGVLNYKMKYEFISVA